MSDHAAQAEAIVRDYPGMNAETLRCARASVDQACLMFTPSRHGNTRRHTTGADSCCVKCHEPAHRHWLRQALDSVQEAESRLAAAHAAGAAQPCPQCAEQQTHTRMFARAADTEKAEAKFWRQRAEQAEAQLAQADAERARLRAMWTDDEIEGMMAPPQEQG